MGAIFDEFEREMADIRARTKSPVKERLALWMMALEREQIVAVAYREDLLQKRLAKLDVPEDLRAVIRRALIWAWRDEEMHALYIRGALLRLGDRLIALSAWAQHFAGAIGGWASSIRHHLSWQDAPLARLAATVFTWFGAMAGKIPRAVRSELRAMSFRDYCAFNIDAERTAAACWARLSELAKEPACADVEGAAAFARIRDDEDRHTEMFRAFYDLFDENDRLKPGAGASELERRIAAIGAHFIEADRRETKNAAGKGGAVYALEASGGENKAELLDRLLAHLPAFAPGAKVAIKATFMLAYHRKDPSPFNDPALIEQLAKTLRDRGASDVAVLEAQNPYDRFYRRRSVHEVAEHFGFRSPYYRIVDATADQTPHVFARGLGQHTISSTWKTADLRLSVSKLRSHPCSIVHLTLGNIEGLGTRVDDYIFAERQADRETALLMILDEFPPDWSILEAFDHTPDGMVGVMGCPNPRHPHRLYAAQDPIALDIVAARHSGLHDPARSSSLRAAMHWFGDPREETQVIGSDRPIEGWRSPIRDDFSAFLSFFAYPVYAYGSGRGVLFVPEMDVEAFPPIAPEGPFLKLARRSLQALIGLRLRR